MSNIKLNDLFLPLAIIIAGGVIGVSVYLKEPTAPDTTNQAETNYQLEKMSPVSDQEALRGNIKAPVKMVVYSDLECPACKFLHLELKKLEEKYVNSGKLAIAFRHFPLDSLHQKSRREAVATECIKELKGGQAYWTFLDGIFETTNSNDSLTDEQLFSLANNLGVSQQSLDACLKLDKHQQAVEKQVAEAMSIGAQGTPFIIVISPDGQHLAIPGAQQASEFEKMLDYLLAEQA